MKKAQNSSPLIVKRVDAARVLGMATRTFDRLQADGILVPAVSGRRGKASLFDLSVIVPAYIGHVTKVRPGDDRKARADRDATLADLNRLRLARETGELVPRKQVILEGQAMAKGTAGMVRRIPRQLDQRGALAPDGKTIAEQVCREVLEEIARWRTVEDAARAAEDPASRA